MKSYSIYTVRRGDETPDEPRNGIYVSQFCERQGTTKYFGPYRYMSDATDKRDLLLEEERKALEAASEE